MTGHIVQAEQAKLRYLTEAIQTASPAMLLTMLYDALETDLSQADLAFDDADLKTINDRLIHAQDIPMALRSTLRNDLWEGAARLGGLYGFLHAELLGANLDKDRARVGRVAVFVSQLGEAWRQAAGRQEFPENVGGVA